MQSGKFGDAVEYRQVIDERAPLPADEAVLERLADLEVLIKERVKPARGSEGQRG